MPNNQQTKSFDLGSRKAKTLFDTWTTNEPPAYVVHHRGSCRENSSFECSVGDSCLKFYYSGKVVIQCSGPDAQKNRSTAEEMEELLTVAPDLVAAVAKLDAQSNRKEKADRPARTVEHSDRQELGDAQIEPPVPSSKVLDGPKSEFFIGGDEAGNGALWGPLVIAVVAVDKQGRAKLEKAGITDSKRYKIPRKLCEAAEVVRKISCWYDVVEISPAEFNERSRRGEKIQHMVMSSYERMVAANGDSRILSSAVATFDKIGGEEDHAAISDRLQHDFGISCTFEKRADANPIFREVSAASILATEKIKAAWEELEEEFEELSEGTDLHRTEITKAGGTVEKCDAANFYLENFGEDFVLARVKNWRA